MEKTRRFEHNLHFDNLLLLTVLILTGMGLVMVYSTSSIFAEERFGESQFFLSRQLFAAGLGMLAMWLAMHVNYELYRKLGVPFLLLSLILLTAVLVPGISPIRGSRRWLTWHGFSFQPSELAKLAMIIFLAHSLARKSEGSGGQEQIKNFQKGFLPYLVVSGIMIGLIFLEPDLGGALNLALLVFLMLFAAGTRISYLLAAGMVSAPMVFYLLASEEYRWQRIITFLNPWEHAQDTGWQLVQSFLAFGSGGIWGVGLGEGRQKLFYLPDAHTDFIFSVIGEELGLVGVVTVAGLFLVILTRGIRIALRAPSTFGCFLAVGLTAAIGLPALINMAVVMGLLPTKGLVLPFLSSGGSSLLINLVAAGILLNISARAYDK
jgi:cell division protein FtsW